MRNALRLPLGAATLCAAFAMMLSPRDADACGGMFCDGGPMPMPVDQTGENIIFVWDGDAIEAHIQIQYMGEAAQFGWVLPLQSVPEFSVGSQPLFDALLASTVPTYGFSQTFDDCSLDDGSDPGNGSFGSTAASSASGDGGGESGDSNGEPPGPQILLTETVGAFEITVLQGDDPMEVYDWLAENGYQQDPEALPILGEYIEEGLVFGAVKLTGGADVDEIHPIVLRFQGSEPCVPLRLTRIAAVDDMGVRTFFLGDARIAPLNYRHVLLNQLKVDWRAPQNYGEVLTEAVDEENADGRAFVTEYAGTSSVVQTGGVLSPSWNANGFSALTVDQVGDELQQQGLLFCDVDFGNGCSFTHPLIESLLGEYVTPPDGVPAAEMWGNWATYAGEVDATLWNGADFSTKLTQRVIEPGQHALELLQQHSYLTRMYTTISPHEMTEDPQFWENEALPEVANLLNGTLRTLCNGDQVFILPDGREVYLPSGEPWPDFPDEPGGIPGAMPSSQIIEAVPDNGAPMRLSDNTEQIDIVLKAWNDEHGWRSSGGGSGSAGGSGSDSDGEANGGEGCGCTSDARSSSMLALVGLAGFALARRRRRR
ncbi:MAG TPA: DUF2330 domain-containing protein [Nannocystaceae bacterium]|nr:DUF2330 domain-containing protein [Nannocystaceae bacterium]